MPEERGPQIFVTPKLNENLTSTVSLNHNIEKGDSIDLEKFSRRKKGGLFENPDTKQTIPPDRGRNSGSGSHGGSWWKLKDRNGKRIATLSKEGKVLRP